MTLFINRLFLFIMLVAIALNGADSLATLKIKSSRLYFENDFFAQQDRYYTVGMKLSLLYEVNPKHPTLSSFPFINDRRKQHFFAAGIAQQIFTPLDQKSADIVEDDRPYAGWLYLSASVFQSDEEHLGAAELQVGIVGPCAKGKEVMFFFHDIFGNTKPQGWDNQLNNELGIVLAYEHKWRFGTSNVILGTDADFFPAAGFALGNVHTYGNAGAAFRIGWNLPRNFGVSLIRPAGESGIPSLGQVAAPGVSNSWHLYFYGFFDSRLVFRNIFLDGNTFSSSHRVEKEPVVADLSVGFAYTYKRFSFTYSYVLRTKEFIAQPDPHQYVSLSISWRFN